MIKNISEILQYRAITQSTIISQEPARLTMVLEIHISEKESEEKMTSEHERLMKTLCDTLPDKAWVSVYLIKYFDKIQLPYFGKHKNGIVNYLEKKRIDKLNSTLHPHYQCYLTVTIPVEEDCDNEFTLFDKMASRSAKETGEDSSLYIEGLSKLDEIYSRMKSNLNGSIIRMNDSRIVNFLSLLMNHSFEKNVNDISEIFKSDITFSFNGFFKSNESGYVHYGNNYHTVLSQRAYGKEKLHDFTSAEMNQIFYNERLKDTPFIVHLSMFFPSKQEGMKAAKVKSGMIAFKQGSSAMFGLFSKLIQKNPEGLPPEILKQYVDEQIAIVETTSDRFIRMAFQVHLWDSDLSTLKTSVKNFSSAISSSYTMKKEKYNIRAAYLSLLPGMEYLNPINIMMSSYIVSDLLPIDMPRICFENKKNQNHVYFHTPEGILTKIDLFDDRASNWNSIVCGPAGSGKSFQVNGLIDMYSIYNPQIAIVDYGGEGAGSYRNMVINNNGTYIEIGFDNKQPFSVNPFDGPYFDKNNEAIAVKLKCLLSTIDRMVYTKDQMTIKRGIQKELCRLFALYYEEHDNNVNNTCDLTDFCNKYLKDNKVVKQFGRDLFTDMFFFINDGIYARFFRKTENIPDKNIICFDLAGLKEHTELRNVLIPTLLQLIAQNILSSSSIERKKMLIFDEAWKDLKGGDMTDFMEAINRTIRKLNGQLTIISQLYDDIKDSPIGKALLANTSYYYFVGGGHNPESLASVKATGEVTNELSAYDLVSIAGQKNKRDSHLLTPFYSGKLQFKPTMEFALFSTTNAEEKNILNKYKRELGVDVVTPDVIELAKKEFAGKY